MARRHSIVEPARAHAHLFVRLYQVRHEHVEAVDMGERRVTAALIELSVGTVMVELSLRPTTGSW